MSFSMYKMYKKLAEDHYNECFQSLKTIYNKMSEKQRARVDWTAPLDEIAEQIRRSTFQIFFQSLAFRATEQHKKYLRMRKEMEFFGKDLPKLTLIHTESKGIRQLRRNIKLWDRRQLKIGSQRQKDNSRIR